MMVGRVRGVLSGHSWTPGLWADSGGQPGTLVATGLPVSGQGPLPQGALQDAELSVPYEVTAGFIWAGFTAASGSIFSPAGPIPFDSDGQSTQNYILGTNMGAGCFTPCWAAATTHEGNIADWIIEIAEPGLDACPPLPE